MRERLHSRHVSWSGTAGVGGPVKSDLDPTGMIFILQYDSDPKHIITSVIDGAS